MESNNIITAPQIDDFGSFYEIWKRDHTGSTAAFYSFMTTPTPEREEFLESVADSISRDFNGGIMEINLKSRG